MESGPSRAPNSVNVRGLWFISCLSLPSLGCGPSVGAFEDPTSGSTGAQTGTTADTGGVGAEDVGDLDTAHDGSTATGVASSGADPSTGGVGTSDADADTGRPQTGGSGDAAETSGGSSDGALPDPFERCTDAPTAQACARAGCMPTVGHPWVFGAIGWCQGAPQLLLCMPPIACEHFDTVCDDDGTAWALSDGCLPDDMQPCDPPVEQPEPLCGD